MALTRFTCGGCGAELQGTAESQVGFCPYCGGQSLLLSAKDSETKTESVLPFQISRAKCAALFREHTRKVLYLSREMKDAAHLEHFIGIYMPYYEYDVAVGASHIQGSMVVESNSRYEVVNTYQIDATMAGDYCGVAYDASRYFDDEIAARALPFDTRRTRPFHPAYLSGFYADAATVPPKTYAQDAAAQAAKDIVAEVSDRLRGQGITLDAGTSTVETHTHRHHNTLLPLWFLTWRKGGRVAYAVINGESGKVVADLPVDMKAFALGCAVLAAALFAALEWLVQPTPMLTSAISLLAGARMAAAIRDGAKRIEETRTHANDKGWFGGAAPPAAAAPPVKGPMKLLTLSPALLVSLLVFAVYLILPGVTASLPQLIAVAVPLYLLLAARPVFARRQSAPEKAPLLAMGLVLAAAAVNAAIVFVSPVNDAWYYLGDAVGILILILASATMMRVYNTGATRPLPKLFDREEVG